ncbi:hypothetical protein M407DRAFT_173769 [Tulasnella calospora MUT 4182]|uniref:Uncharacterized protein n=1 Tax=Tulasnella calospora MUT 4182 TaxID=1051891 RepID=A0A0C3QDJ4_9AGAM|nr:hypothetical protein M407DRAFT_173769 [Tulasnella calospora MUT 4182]
MGLEYRRLAPTPPQRFPSNTLTQPANFRNRALMHVSSMCCQRPPFRRRLLITQGSKSVFLAAALPCYGFTGGKEIGRLPGVGRFRQSCSLDNFQYSFPCQMITKQRERERDDIKRKTDNENRLHSKIQIQIQSNPINQ